MTYLYVSIQNKKLTPTDFTFVTTRVVDAKCTPTSSISFHRVNVFENVGIPVGSFVQNSFTCIRFAKNKFKWKINCFNE